MTSKKKEKDALSQKFTPVAQQLLDGVSQVLIDEGQTPTSAIVAVEYGEKSAVISLGNASLLSLCNMLASMLSNYVAVTEVSAFEALSLFQANFQYKTKHRENFYVKEVSK